MSQTFVHGPRNASVGREINSDVLALALSVRACASVRRDVDKPLPPLWRTQAVIDEILGISGAIQTGTAWNLLTRGGRGTKKSPSAGESARLCEFCREKPVLPGRRSNRFCSRSCRVNAATARKRAAYLASKSPVCAECGKGFVLTRPHRRFCSESCRKRHNRPEAKARRARKAQEIVQVQEVGA